MKWQEGCEGIKEFVPIMVKVNNLYFLFDFQIIKLGD